MSISLHDASVRSFLQILPSVLSQIDKAQAHCRSAGQPDDVLSTASLAPDMWNYAKQVTIVAAHSAGAIEGVRRGVFGPDLSTPPTDFDSLRACIADAVTLLEAVEPGELDAIAGRDMRFEFGERRMDFTVADFLLSFSLPNFYFHATTAYAILRNQGVQVGKMDFLGKVRLKG